MLGEKMRKQGVCRWSLSMTLDIAKNGVSLSALILIAIGASDPTSLPSAKPYPTATCLCENIYIRLRSSSHFLSFNPTIMKAEDGDDRSSSTPTAASKSVSAQDKDKPRLTDQEKKNNHIASEQKRRAAIREGFDRLTELVPGLEGQGRSESIVLQKTVDFMHLKLQERQNLIAEIESKGGRVDDSLRPS